MPKDILKIHIDGCEALLIEQPYQLQENDIWFFQTIITSGGAVGGQHIHKEEVCNRLSAKAGPGELIHHEGIWYWKLLSNTQ